MKGRSCIHQGQLRLSKRSLYVKQDALKGCKPFIFHRIDRLCRSGGAIFRSKAQKNHFRSLAMQDESFHPAWSVSKTSFFDTLGRSCLRQERFFM